MDGPDEGVEENTGEERALSRLRGGARSGESSTSITSSAWARAKGGVRGAENGFVRIVPTRAGWPLEPEMAAARGAAGCRGPR